jgi:hypothetical protein
VLGIDPRVTEPPVGMADLATPDRLEERLGEADFVILTTPETPDTVGMFNTRLFARMKRGAYFIKMQHAPINACQSRSLPHQSSAPPKGQRGERTASSARDHGQTEADSERGEDTDL